MSEARFIDSVTGKIVPIEDRPGLENEILADKIVVPLSDKVPIERDGKRGFVKARALKDFLSAGWKVETKTRTEILDHADYMRDKYGTYGVGLGVAATNFADEFLMGLPEIAHQYAADPIEYAKREYLKDQYPFADVIGNVGGFLGSMLYGGPVGAIGRMGAKAGVGAERAVTGVLGSSRVFPQIMGKTAKYGTEGIVGAAPFAATEMVFGDKQAAAESLLLGGGIGALFGVPTVAFKKMTGFGKDALDMLSKKADPAQAKDVRNTIITKLGKIYTDKDDKFIDYYVDNYQRLKGGIEESAEELAPRLAGAYEDVAVNIRNLNDELRDNTFGYNQIKDIEIPKPPKALEDLSPDLSQAIKEADTSIAGLQQRALDLKDKIRQVDAFKPEKPVQRFEEISDLLETTAKAESKNLSKLSTESYKILDDAAGSFETKDILGAIKAQWRKLGIPDEKGKIKHVSASAKKDAARLAALHKDIKSLGKTIQTKNGKGLLKQIDGDIEYSDLGFKRDTEFNKALKSIRQTIDKNLKQHKPYADKMEELAERTNKFVEFEKTFFKGDKPNLAVIKGINKPENFKKRELLYEISDRFRRAGVAEEGITGPIDEFEELVKKYDLDVREQATAKAMLRQEEQQLGIERGTLTAQRKDIDEQIKKARLESQIAYDSQVKEKKRKLASIDFDRSDLKNRIYELKKEEKMLRPLKKGRDAISNLRYLNKNQQVINALEFLGKKPGYENVKRKATDIAMIEGLTLKNPNGSRRVNSTAGLLGVLGGLLRSNVGAGTGTAVGMAFDPMLAGLGAVAGHVMDGKGGSFLKAAIDLQMGAHKPFIRMEGVIGKTFRKVDDIGSAIKNKTKLSPRKFGESKSYIIFRMLDAQGVNSREKFIDSHEKLEGLIFNPEALEEKIQEFIDDLNLVDMPETAQAVAVKMVQMVQHSYETMPKPAPSLMPNEKDIWEPSSLELSDWFDRMAVMDDPFIAVDDMIEGTLTSSEIDTFKQIYPTLFQYVQAEILDLFTSGEIKPSYNQTMAMSLFMGMDFNSSLNADYIANNQAAYQLADQQAEQQPNVKGTPKAVKKTTTTKAERLATL